MSGLTAPEMLFIVALGLAGIGLYGLLVMRNLIKLIVALQIMAKGAMLALVTAGAASGQLQLGQSLAVSVIVVDTLVAVVALALAVQVRRRCGTLDARELGTLKG
jgi:NADH-quinone oxidoreductase subunit K